MAKMAKKKQSSEVNPRSRAAKRATSPSIDVDKSIKETPRVLGSSAVLGVSHNSGVSKKKKSKHVTRAQRMRQEKGLSRAEAVMDQMEKKVDGARARLKTRNSRKALWEDVNETTADEKRKTAKAPGRGKTAEEGDDDEEQIQDEADADMEHPAASHISILTETAALEATQASDQSPIHALHQDETDLIT